MLRRVRSIHCWLAAIDRTPHYERCLVCTASSTDSGLKPRRIIPSISMSGTPLRPPLFDSISERADESRSMLYSIRLTPRELRCDRALVQCGHQSVMYITTLMSRTGRSFGSSLAGGAGAGWFCAACCSCPVIGVCGDGAAGLLISGRGCCMATSPGAGASCFDDETVADDGPPESAFGRNLATSR